MAYSIVEVVQWGLVPCKIVNSGAVLRWGVAGHKDGVLVKLFG